MLESGVDMQTVIHVVLAPPQLQVALSGEFDLAVRDHLRNRLAEAPALGCAEIVVDAGAVEFIDCSCLRAIATAHRHLQQAGGRLVITRPSPRFVETCRLAGYWQLLEACDPRPPATVRPGRRRTGVAAG